MWRLAVQLFLTVFKLSKNSGQLRVLLERFAVVEIMNEDYELLSTRAKVHLISEELAQFDNVVHLFPTNELVYRHNNMVLKYEKTL